MAGTFILKTVILFCFSPEPAATVLIRRRRCLRVKRFATAFYLPRGLTSLRSTHSQRRVMDRAATGVSRGPLRGY